MNIIWHGQSYFEIVATPAKNNQIKIAIDPFSEEIGLKMPKLEAGIVLLTHDRHSYNSIKAISGNPFLISGPGEYEIKNIFIQGIPSSVTEISSHLLPRPASRHSATGNKKEESENTIYTIEAEDLKLCHLGDLDQKELTEEQVEKIGDIDVLMVPVGGISTISAKEALRIMAQVEPKVTIPMHYALPKLKVKLDGLDKFLKPLGIKSIISESKLSLKKKDISSEEAKIVVLKP